MGYLRQLSDFSFKINSEGQTTFFPWGIIGKGFVIPNKEIEGNIRKTLTIQIICELSLVIFIGVFLGLWIVLAAFTPVIIFVEWLQRKRFIRGLEQSSEKLHFKENIKKLFTNENR